MSNIKEKAKNYWEDHKVNIIACGAVTTVIGIGLIAYKSYVNGFIDGGFTGCHLAIDFLEEKFPGESNARELWERYGKEHPDQIVHRKVFGKWS